MKPQILQVFKKKNWFFLCVYGNMISFCGVYFHKFTLCHFYVLVILFIGMYCITFRNIYLSK